MSDKLNKIFSGSECLTEDLLLKYLANKLPDKEKRSVELHLADCEMCSDQLEGMASVQDYSRANKIIAEINEAVIEQSSGKQKKIFLLDYRFRIAASVVIILTIGSLLIYNFYLKQDPAKIFSDNFNPYPALNSEKIADAATPSGKDSNESEPIAGLRLDDKQKTAFAQTGGEGKKDEFKCKGAVAANSDGTIVTAEGKSGAGASLAKESREVAVTRESGYFANEETKSEVVKIVTDELEVADVMQSVTLEQGAKVPEKVQNAKPVESRAMGGTVAETKKPGDLPALEEKKDAAPAEGQTEVERALYKKGEKAGKDKKKETANKNAPALDDAEDSKNYRTNQEAVTISGDRKQDGDQRQKNRKDADKSGLLVSGKGDSIEVPPAMVVGNEITLASTNGNNSYNVAINKYNAKQYETAALMFEQIPATSPDYYAALFYAGVSYLCIDKPDQAIEKFDKTLMEKDGRFYEASLWYKALALVKKKNTTDAIDNLQKVIELKNDYKEKAEKMIEDLN